MRKSNFTISVLFDKRTVIKGTKTSPIVLAISCAKIQFRVSLKLYATHEDYKRALSNKGGSEEIKSLRKEISFYVDKAETIIERMPVFSRESFQKLFKSETHLLTADKTDVVFLFNEKLDELKKEERIGTANIYKLAMKSFLKYKSPLFFEDINEKFLKAYKAWMINEGNSSSTAQIYLRHLKAIFNKAIKEGYISEKHYAFKNYSIGVSSKSKSVLYPEQLKALWNYEPVGIRESRAKAYFFFCYLCNGMNFKDMCYLKQKDIKDNVLSFVRAKTRLTNSVSDKQIRVYMHSEVLKIIEQWGNKSNNPNDYIFPILNGRKNIFEQESGKARYRKVANKMLRRIGKKLGFDVSLCLNLARHSFATRLKLDGTPTSFITDALGHSSSKTTEHYLKSIPDSKFKAISESLLQFE